jgi:hypothetical protein
MIKNFPSLETAALTMISENSRLEQDNESYHNELKSQERIEAIASDKRMRIFAILLKTFLCLAKWFSYSF